MKRFAATLFAGLLAAAPAFAQDFSKVEVKTQKLTDNVYMLVGSGGNIGLAVGEDAVFLVDDQYAPLTPKILAAIAAITPKPVRFVVNTHWHGDHSGGNENLGKAGALIVAHDNVRRRMNSHQVVEFFKMTQPPQPKDSLPVITFSTDTTFHINGDEVHAFHIPTAHTDSDAVVHFRKANVIHMGDIYFNWMYPFIDMPNGGTPEGVVVACDRALSLANDTTKIIPGHGPLASKADLKEYRDMVAAISSRVKAAIRDGKKLEEITAMPLSSDYDAKWGQGFIKAPKFIEMLAKGYLQK